jgi:hypothetical protein
VFPHSLKPITPTEFNQNKQAAFVEFSPKSGRTARRLARRAAAYGAHFPAPEYDSTRRPGLFAAVKPSGQRRRIGAAAGTSGMADLWPKRLLRKKPCFCLSDMLRMEE